MNVLWKCFHCATLFTINLCMVQHILHNSCTTNFFVVVAIKCQFFFVLSEMDLNQYNYQYYYSYLQNQSLSTSENSQNPPQYVMYRPPHSSENFQNPPQYVMCPPPPPTSENSQNPPQYIMYPPPPHMWYMHPSSNVEPPTNGSSQNPQIYSQPSTPTNSNTCYRPSLSNIVLPSNEIESPIGVDGIQLDEGDENSSGKKVVPHSRSRKM